MCPQVWVVKKTVSQDGWIKYELSDGTVINDMTRMFGHKCQQQHRNRNISRHQKQRNTQNSTRTKGCKMKCPYCNTKLIITYNGLACSNMRCEKSRSGG